MIFGVIGIVCLGVLTFATCCSPTWLIEGYARLTADFFTSFPSRRAEPGRHPLGLGRHDAGDAGHRAVPPCRSASPPASTSRNTRRSNWMTDIIEINISNLAGVPSIVYGLLALGLFVYQFGFGQSIPPPA
jgi:phosphate transport system permease protein